MEKQFNLLKKLCRKHGMRLTPQRLEIFRVINSAKDHPSAFEVYQRVSSRNPAISPDTVYRTLDTFDQCELIDKVEFLDFKIRFDPNINTHHHFICTECGSIRDFDWKNFDEVDLPPNVMEWGQPKTRQAQIKGVCVKCSEERNL
jgi:Fur family peroxide stress response transcriptional regulator